MVRSWLMYIIATVIAIWPFCAGAQPPDKFYSYRLDERNGLSDDHVTFIFKDRNGLLWVGTSFGLNLLDGAEITVFEHQQGSNNTICDNDIGCLAQDSSGLLWVGTHHGLSQLDIPSRKWKDISLSHQGNKEEILSLAISSKHLVYISCASGLYAYDTRQQQMNHLILPGVGKDLALNNRLTKLLYDEDGILWINTFNGLWSYNEQTGRFSHAVSAQNDPEFNGLFTALVKDHHGFLWLGTWGHNLKRYDPRTKTLKTFHLPIADVVIKDLVEIPLPNGGYGILANQGLYYFDTQHEQFHQLPAKTESISCLYYNAALRRLWVGTTQGLYLSKPFQTYFKTHYFDTRATGQGLSFMDWKGQLLVGGGNDYFLRLFDKNLKQTQNYSAVLRGKGAECLSIQPVGPEEVWCGTTRGVAQVNLSGRKATFIKLEAGASPTGTSLNFITYLFQDAQKSWWLFPWRNGIWKIDSSHARPYQVFQGFTTQFGILKNLVIFGACEDKNGNIWMSDFEEGIILFDKKTGQFSKPFKNDLGEFLSCPQIIYRNGYCYSFTEGTLLVWQVDDRKLHRVELPAATYKRIWSIETDHAGNLWMATRNGLGVYDLKRRAFLHFTTADGLPENNMDGSLYTCSDGRIIFGSASYLISFQPESLLQSVQPAPHLTLSLVEVNDKPLPFKTSKNIHIPYNSNHLTFRWALNDYTDPLNNYYYYKLEGVDARWHYAGKTGRVDFNSLLPGSYRLLMKGENANGISSSNILTASFVINPPFWRSTWFALLLLFSTALFFYGLYRYRLGQALKLQELRNKISRDLHDEIGSTLSSIAIISEIAIHRQDGDTKMLYEIRENAQMLMEKMDDIVWSINPQNDSLQNLFLRIQTFAANLFELKGINYQISIDENISNIRLNMADRQHLYLILKEAINNVVKHANCTEAGIEITFAHHLLSISIRDNGQGFDTTHAADGNGLRNIQSRAAELGATLQWRSVKNKGTSIDIGLKIV